MMIAGTAAGALLDQARRMVAESAASVDTGERFRWAHLAALRIAAAVLAERGRPARARRRLMSVWVLLDTVAPEFGAQAAFFAAGAPVRSAIEAGMPGAVTARQADEQLRAADEFLAVVEDSLGLLAAPLAS
jgi:hypothetical protein